MNLESMPKMPRNNLVRLALTILLTLLSSRVEANDAAAETAAGGLQLRNERRISITKERLYITKKPIGSTPSNLPNLQNEYSVTVEYEFLNESTEDVITEVAFPLPAFNYPWEDIIQDRRIRGFKLEVDGKIVPFATEVRAMANGQDVTELLSKTGIEIESFGQFVHDLEHSPKPNLYQVLRLPEESQVLLKAAGAIDNDLAPKWIVAITHHWKQLFPAGKVVKVRHEYEAIPGFSYSYEVGDYLSSLDDGCFDAGLTRSLEAGQAQLPKSYEGVLIQAEWVKYILTTANTWKMPIRDFELIVERPAGQYVSFCWDGKVEKLSPTQFKATTHNFVPKRELQIYFLSVGVSP